MKIFCIIFALLLLSSELSAQCGCLGGSAIGGIVPAGIVANSGILKEGKARTLLFYRYGFGDKYYNGDSYIGKNIGLIRENKFHYLGLIFDYGVFEDFTTELELGYFIEKKQDFYDKSISKSGFSHISPGFKYNIYNSLIDQIEYTLGTSFKIPLQKASDTLSQHLSPSTGAFGFAISSYLRKSFKRENLSLLLINRLEINTKNDIGYLYGNSLISSFIVSKFLLENFSASFELRNEYRQKDEYKGRKIEDSGNFILILAPQIGFNIDNFYVSANFDFPFYKYFNGKQLTNSYYFGFNIFYQTK